MQLALVQHVQSASTADADFARGYRLYSNEQYAAARPLLESVLSDESAALRDYALYYLGRVAMANEDWAGARARFSRLEREYPFSRLANDAAFQLTRVELKQNRYDRVIERAQTLYARHQNERLRARASFYLGRAYEGLGRVRKAFAQFQQARKEAPRSTWSVQSKKRIAHLRSVDPGLRAEGGTGLLAEARQLYREADYAAAERYYRRALEETNYRRLSLLGLAKVYRKTRERSKEEKVQRDILRYYPDTAFARDALMRIAIIQWNRDENEEALRTFRRFKARYPGHPQAAFATYAVGRIHESRSEWNTAIRIYRSFGNTYARSRFREDAAWRLAWIHYLREDYASARASFQKIANRPGNFRTAGSFWQARSAEALGMDAEARRLYRSLARNPISPYYRGLARERLRGLGESEPEEPALAKIRPTPGPLQLGTRASFHLVRAQALARTGLNRLARLELDRVKASAPSDRELKRFLMREYAAVQAYDASVALAHQLPESEEALRHRFPLSYWDIVRRHAAQAGVDPFFVVALIRQESLFNPTAVSPADALGLMQLLHRTARSEAARLGLPEPERGRLFDPEFNIQLGTHHLKRLLSRYGQSGVKALAAYNAGPKPVERWSRNFAGATDYEFAERISYKETRLYVKKVLRNYWAYKELYEEKATREERTTGPRDQ